MFPSGRIRAAGFGSRHSRDCVFENELFLVIGFQDDRIFVLGSESALQLVSTHEEYSDRYLVASNRFEIDVLDIL